MSAVRHSLTAAASAVLQVEFTETPLFMVVFFSSFFFFFYLVCSGLLTWCNEMSLLCPRSDGRTVYIYVHYMYSVQVSVCRCIGAYSYMGDLCQIALMLCLMSTWLCLHVSAYQWIPDTHLLRHMHARTHILTLTHTHTQKHLHCCLTYVI